MNQIEDELRIHVLPRVIRAQYLRRQWFWWIGQAYIYGNEVLTVIWSVGLAGPLFNAFRGVGSGQPPGQALDIASLLATPLGWLGLAALFCWGLLKTVANRMDAVVKCASVEGCETGMQNVESALNDILGAGQPMADLGELKKQKLNPIFDRAVQDKIWPWKRKSWDTEVDKKVKSETERLVAQFAGKWQQGRDSDIRI